jgi:hypothetical protein
MDPIQLYYTVHQTPFHPLRVVLKDGRTYDILSRGLLIVGASWLDVGIQAEGEEPGIAEKFIMVPLNEIARVERLSDTTTPSVAG